MTKGMVLAAVAAIFVTFAFVQMAAAQYPPPRGGIVCGGSQTIQPPSTGNAGLLTGYGAGPSGLQTPLIGAATVTSERAVQITAIVHDAAGNPVAGAQVFFNIVPQPSDGASLDTAVETTDGSGRATTTLFVAGGSGQVIVSAKTADGLECRVITDALQEVRFVIQPPSTGDGGVLTGGEAANVGISAALTGAALIAGALAITAGRSRRTQGRL